MAQVCQLTGGIGVQGEPLTWLRVGYLGIKEPQISFLSPGRTLVSGVLCGCALALWRGGGVKAIAPWDAVASFAVRE